jgi:hypothetical protein
MPNNTRKPITLLAIIAFSLISAGAINTAYSSQSSAESGQPASLNTISGKVTDVIESAGYTYAEVETGNKKVWGATTTTSVKIGDTISFSTSMPMENFHSKALNRDFPLVYFATSFSPATTLTKPETTAPAAPHPQITHQQTTRPLKKFSKAEGGNTIAELYAEKDKLNGQTIHVRGQVTKFTGNVMGRNWLHISDSSTQDDLTITTSGTAAIDDVIDVEGKLALNKDFNYGYVYPLIVEEATITKE